MYYVIIIVIVNLVTHTTRYIFHIIVCVCDYQRLYRIVDAGVTFYFQYTAVCWYFWLFEIPFRTGVDISTMNRPRNQAEQEMKARARIYVANIPQAGMSRKEVVSVFHKYGEIDSKSSFISIAVAFNEKG